MLDSSKNVQRLRIAGPCVPDLWGKSLDSLKIVAYYIRLCVNYILDLLGIS